MAERSPITALVPWAAALVVSSLFTAGFALWWEQPPGVPQIRDGATLTLDRDALARVDLALVHEELVPNWVVATGGVKELHWERLRREVARDPNLGALLDRMAELIEADPVLNAKELLALVRTWNDYLAAAGEPWRLAGEVAVGSEGGTLRLKSYLVLLGDGRVDVGSSSYVASVRRRVDDTTQVDTWLGHVHSHEDGVVVLLDRVTSFALDRVWTMLDPALDAELDPLQRAFAPAVRAEVAEALPADAVEALRLSAEDRFWMIRAADSVHFRHQCGSQFYIARVPWNGMSPRDLATLQLYAAGSDTRPCPDVTEQEALIFAARSYHVRRVPGVREALERLVAWVAGAVAIHEARHAADVEQLEGQPIACLGCPEGTSHIAALEGSAYVASFSHPSTAALSLFQACGLDPALVPDRAEMVRFLAARLQEGGCDGTPADDLPIRARALESELFARSEPVELVDFPAGLPVSSEYTAP